MSIQHKSLAAGRWQRMPLAEQLANVGSEVERTISWREKGDLEYSRQALWRALELLSFTKDSVKGSQLREISRLYELLVDYFAGGNQFKSTDRLWRNYFNSFTYLTALRRSKV
ncbi:MAG: hypothetical protein WEC39_01340 [Patescibacteria group bacterium]